MLSTCVIEDSANSDGWVLRAKVCTGVAECQNIQVPLDGTPVRAVPSGVTFLAPVRHTCVEGLRPAHRLFVRALGIFGHFDVRQGKQTAVRVVVVWEGMRIVSPGVLSDPATQPEPVRVEVGDDGEVVKPIPDIPEVLAITVLAKTILDPAPSAQLFEPFGMVFVIEVGGVICICGDKISEAGGQEAFVSHSLPIAKRREGSDLLGSVFAELEGIAEIADNDLRKVIVEARQGRVDPLLLVRRVMQPDIVGM
ncbi:hypothetical protein VTJ83DRAFT_4074 [Remersonia thermophila]|uniref:Uncharacterized protein n=1 Tax=Remersonia thermophila TaxID=72144 RepID=A0ABR4DFT6_9PEZI